MDDAPLVFAHGITGGRLLERGKVRWIGTWQALGIDRRPLRSPITWTDGVQDTDDLVPDGPLHSVFGVKVYGRFQDQAARWSRDFRCLAYDWRRDLSESVLRLKALLSEVREAHGRPARLVAHSMGGLVSWLTLREDPTLASSVLFVGVPFGPGISFGGNMHAGNKLGLNSKLGDVSAHGSWVAPYTFFPAGDPGVPGTDHDWYDAAAWEANGFGVFADPSLDNDAWRPHVQHAVAAAKAVRTVLDQPHPEPHELPPIAVLSGVAHGSVQEVLKGGPRSTRGWDFHSGRSIEGDGAVATGNTFPPGDLEVIAATTQQSHQQLLDDLPTVQTLLEGLAEKES